ncbi:MAG: hypothetical protein Q8S73_37680 [Deltaproteobacteria bacterium]|nr:hypothetical protein [Myxococcales bacterium]MDP3219892.1 hypothetical protein [Deltaproteobacteria bacterium]
MPSGRVRYRLEGDRVCIDIRLRTTQQLFDGRDPAPFRERDLDEDMVEYILGAVQEIPAKQALRVVFMIAGDPEAQLGEEDITAAVRGHFRYEREKLDRDLRLHVRRGQFTLLVGLAALALFLTLAELTASLRATHFRQILREGLVITGWVAMWRPLDVLLYDWWPLLETRRRIDRIVRADMAVRHGALVLPAPGLP